MRDATLHQFVRGCLREAAIAADQAVESGLAMFVDMDGSSIELTLYDPNKALAMLQVIGKSNKKMTPDLEQEIKYAITNGTLGSMMARQPYDNCQGAWEIASSAAEKGYGPMLYDILMAIAPNKTVMSDRESVSPSAKGVWSYYFWNRGDVEKLKLDDKSAPKTPTKFDDCSVFDAEMKRGDDVNPLNYAYKSKTSPKGAALERNHRDFLDSAWTTLKHLGINKKMITTYLKSANIFFFTHKMRNDRDSHREEEDDSKGNITEPDSDSY